jgi:deoxyadenosine/deoxycytidine kinase
MQKARIVTIDGNIGSGKSTLLDNLKNYYKNNMNVVFADEPVSEWESIKDSKGVTMLQKFYQDQKTYSFPFQMMAYISRLHILRTIVKENPSAIIITERSLHTDRLVFAKMLFDSGLIEDVNYQIYLKWFDELVGNLKIDGIIYLKTGHLTCFNRIKSRNRQGEHIPPSYVADCQYYHEKWLTGYSRVLELDGEVDFSRGLPWDWKHRINNFFTR